MIVCQQCDTEYPDGAQWCNLCEISLASDNSSRLFDQERLVTEKRADRQARDLAFKAMLAMSLVTPLLAVQQMLAGKGLQFGFATLLLLAAVLAASSAWAISQEKPWARQVAIASAGLALFAFPMGTVAAVLLLIFLFTGRWSG